MSWLRHKAEVIRNMAVNRGEMPKWLGDDLVCYFTGTKLNGWNNSVDAKWFDASGNGRHMAMNNLAWEGNSNLDGYGFNVDGVDDYGSIADSADTRLTQGGTLMAWINPRTLGEGSNGRIIDKSNGDWGTSGYTLHLLPSNAFRCVINSSAATVSTSSVITLNKPQLAAVTFSTLGRHLYINAIDVTASGGTETALPPDVAGTVCIGNRANATDRTFDGQIDKPRIIKRALTQAEIAQIYQNERRFYGV